MPQNKSQRTSNNREAGNVFILILLGITLFGALMYSFSRSSNQGTGNLTKQQAKIAAQEILNYARLVEGAVDRVRRNGCSETEISFDNAVVSGYSNPNSPPDKSCHIFEDEGGKVDYAELPESYIDSSFSSYQADLNRTWGEWIYSGADTIRGVGTTCATSNCKELAAYIHFINKNICFELNKNLGIALIAGDAPPERTASPPGGFVADKFIGTFKNTAEGVDVGIIGAGTACLKVAVSGNNYYLFYHVLLAR